LRDLLGAIYEFHREAGPRGGSPSTVPTPRTSPLTILTPSKPRFIISRVVWIEIDVQAGYSAVSKFEDVAETSARSFASCPRLTGHFAV